MRNILLTILLLSISNCFSQTIRGIIVSTPISGIGDSDTLSIKAKKSMYFNYSYNNKKSIQILVSKEESSTDTIIVRKYNMEVKTTSTINRPNIITYYKNYNDNIYHLGYTMNNKSTDIEDKIPLYNWTLTDDSKSISGYKCKKATTSRILLGRKQDIVAWYCEDIPINDGPMDFNGLPGFIFEIEILKNTISTFKKIKFFLKENTEIIAPKNKTSPLTILEYQRRLNNGTL